MFSVIFEIILTRIKETLEKQEKPNGQKSNDDHHLQSIIMIHAK